MFDRKAYLREYQKEWMRKRRNEFFSDKQCNVCGSKEKLELDHIDPGSKKYNPGSLWSMSDTNPNKITELAKCQVLCYNCHLQKSKVQSWTKPLVHGYGGYQRKCKCEICFEAMREVNRSERRKLRRKKRRLLLRNSAAE